jgi:tetratricopeptide (TPR) repeat protein
MAEPTDEIRLEQAKALYNLVTALGKDQKFDKAEKWLGRLLQMAEPTDEIRLEQATATNNLIQCYIKAKNWQRAEQIYVEHLMPLATRIETAEYGWPFAAAAYRLLTHPVYIDYAQQPDRFPEHGENITAVFQQRVSFLSGLINQFGENPDWQQLIEITRGDKTFQECLRFYFPPPPAG